MYGAIKKYLHETADEALRTKDIKHGERNY